MILLDTHVLLWYRAGVALKKEALQAIARASHQNALAVSAISAWEIGMLAANGRIRLGRSASEYFRTLLSRPDVCEIPVTAAIGTRAAELARTFQADPADHMLVATAIELDCPIATRDRGILRFASRSAGTVQAIAC